MARRRGGRSSNKPIFNPMPGDHAWLADGRKCRVVNRDRKEGINIATVRFQDKKDPTITSGPFVEVRVRDLLEHPPPDVEGGVAAPPPTPGSRPPITFDVVNTVNTMLSNHYDFGIHAHGCADVKRDRKLHGCDVYHHYEATPKEVQEAEINELAESGFGDAAEEFVFKIFPCCKPKRTSARAGQPRRRSANSADLQGDKDPLRSEPGSGSVPKARRAKRRATTTSNKRRTTVARRTASTKEAPAKGRKRGRTREAAPEPKGNGNSEPSTRMTHADKLKLVPEIVKRLKAGETFTEIRQDEDMPSSGLRKALFEKGYDTKGNRIQSDEDLSELEGKALVREVVKLRQDGVPWYRIELAADMPQAELKEMLIDAGHEDLTKRVPRAADEEEVEEAPKRGRSKRGSTKAETKSEAKPTRKRGRSRRSNPSDED